MNREIKFRGKTVPDGRWVYGYYVVMENETKTVTRHAIMDLLDKENQYLKDGKSYHMSLSVVEAETVGQFTGLHDANGKEIYEGDIVRFNQKFLIENILRVSYEYSHRGGFSLCTKEGYYSMFGDAWLEPFYCEVIGNIYDNPELLKGGKK